MPLRILLTSDFYPPFVGGAERQVQLLAQELGQRGYEVQVATVWHAGHQERENDRGVLVHWIKGLTTRVPWFSSDPRRRFHPPCPDPGMVWGLRGIARRFKPDVVHANGWIAFSSAAALLGTNIPLLVSARDYGYSCALRTLMHKGQQCAGPTLRTCLGCAQQTYGAPKGWAAVGGVLAGKAVLARKIRAIHSVSTFVQDVMLRDLVHLHRSGRAPRGLVTAVTPSFSQPDYGDRTHTELPGLPDEPFILFVGALQAHKGLQILLNAYARLASPPPLVLIGTVWPDTPSTFPPAVKVFRNVPHAQVMDAWERCLFGVAPSIWPDPLPGVVREAMLTGKTVIGSAVGGIPDMLVDGETGLLVPPGNIDALTKAMQRLIAEPLLRERMGRAASRRAQAYTASVIVPQFEQLYRNLVAAPATPSMTKARP